MSLSQHLTYSCLGIWQKAHHRFTRLNLTCTLAAAVRMHLFPNHSPDGVTPAAVISVTSSAIFLERPGKWVVMITLKLVAHITKTVE